MRRFPTLSIWRTTTVAVVAAAGLLLAACSSGASSSNHSSGGVVTFAEEPATPPTYISPLMGAEQESNANLYQFSNQLYLPLYWFGEHGQPTINMGLSVAKPPIFSNGNKTVTINMKHWVWSNGHPITARDVVFWMNLLSAVTDPHSPTIGNSSTPGPAWFDFSPGGFPENVVSYRATGTYQLVMNLNRAYNPTWFLYNELSQVYPLPTSTWDKLSASGAVGNYDAEAESRTTLSGTSSPASYVPVNPGTASSGALGVAAFVNSQAETLATYQTNPLWKVVDGPFKLAQFTTEGYVKMVPNKSYSGSPKPSIAAFVELPFTTDTAEFNSLRAGGVDIGYIPPQDMNQKAALERQGYQFSPWYEFQTWYAAYNFTNPTVGPILQQLYFRQAFQSLLNQKQYIKQFDAGIGTVNNGPIPTYPPHNAFESKLEAGSPVYPFDPSKAVALLKDHGWSVQLGGTSTCTRPGTAANQCGAGIKQGQPAILKMLYVSGSLEATEQMEALQSALRQYAGIVMTLQQAPFSTVIATMDNSCTFKTPCPAWDLANWNFGWSYSPDFYPTGEAIFACGAASNGGDYCNATNDHLIQLTDTAPTNAASLRALIEYQDFLARQLPVIWLPNIPFQFTMYKNSIKNVVPQDVFDIVYPQYYKVG